MGLLRLILEASRKKVNIDMTGDGTGFCSFCGKVDRMDGCFKWS
jgi:hypothetical protein